MSVTIAIVGRPNVGKSTLFNRLTGRRKAITHDLPGVTRDRCAADARRPRGGKVVVVDTGGFEPDSEAQIPALVRGQAMLAIQDAALVIFLVDGVYGITPPDEEIAKELRRTGKKVIVAVNKADRRAATHAESDFAALAYPVVAISAEHGAGMADLWDEIEKILPPPTDEEEEEAPQELAVTIVGRPNAGKSSLLNSLVGEERVLVTEIPGTTRDSIDTIVNVTGHNIRLIDTAGIRRKGRTDRGPEVLSVVMARKAIERAHICLVLIDASAGITAQDAHVAGYVHEAARGVVVVINKADLLANPEVDRAKLREQVVDRLKFFKDTPVVFISALNGQNVDQVLPAAIEVGKSFFFRAGTGELNRVLHAAWERQPPPGGRRPPRLYYTTQIGSGPPRFALYVSGTGELHFSYMRYLENSLRDVFGLAGVPIRFMMRGKRERSG